MTPKVSSSSKGGSVLFYPENAHLIFWRTHPQTREEGDKSRNAARRRPRRPQRSETSSRLFPTRSIRPVSRASTSLHRSRPSSFQGTSSSRAQKKKSNSKRFEMTAKSDVCTFLRVRRRQQRKRRRDPRTSRAARDSDAGGKTRRRHGC